MKLVFENEGEKSCVRATLERLLREMPERSVTTGEENNLRMALAIVNATETGREP